MYVIGIVCQASVIFGTQCITGMFEADHYNARVEAWNVLHWLIANLSMLHVFFVCVQSASNAVLLV